MEKKTKAFCFHIHAMHGSNKNPVRTCKVMTVFATNISDARRKAVQFYDGKGIVKIESVEVNN